MDFSDLTRWRVNASDRWVAAKIAAIGECIRCPNCRRLFDKVVWNKTFCKEECGKEYRKRTAEWVRLEKERQVTLRFQRAGTLRKQVKRVTSKPYCPACNKVGMSHCCDPINCGGVIYPETKKEPEMNVVYRVEWTESEAGMGCRPDGVSYAFDSFLLEERKKQMAQTGSPGCYTRGGDIGMCIIDDELRQKIHDNGGVFTTNRLDDPGMKGTFIPRK